MFISNVPHVTSHIPVLRRICAWFSSGATLSKFLIYEQGSHVFILNLALQLMQLPCLAPKWTVSSLKVRMDCF